MAVPGLSCSMWDQVPRPGIEPWPPALRAQSLSRWTTREVPKMEDYIQECKFCWGESQGGIVREFEMGMYTPLYLQWITNKDLLYSTGNSAQCYVPA